MVAFCIQFKVIEDTFCALIPVIRVLLYHFKYNFLENIRNSRGYAPA